MILCKKKYINNHEIKCIEWPLLCINFELKNCLDEEMDIQILTRIYFHAERNFDYDNFYILRRNDRLNGRGSSSS